MKMIKNKWVSLPTIGVILLALVQAGYSFYMNQQAKAYVDRISGVQASELDSEGVYIRWGENTEPLSCPVSLEFIWEHADGYAFAEVPPVHFTALEHLAVAKSKNGHISHEPISEEYLKMLQAIPGEWHYKIIFKFNCSLIDIDYLSWINFSETHVIKPVVINV